MRTLCVFGLAALQLALAAAPLSAQPRICLNPRDIQSSQPQDHGKSILFTMRNGARWQNQLQNACPDLDFNGFAWTLPDNQICDGEQTLKVIGSGQICKLGKFEQMTPARAPG